MHCRPAVIDNSFLQSPNRPRIFLMLLAPQFKSAARLLISSCVLLAGAASAQPAAVKIDGAWARASVQGQSGTGAFMNLTASESTRLVGVSTPLAGVAEVHEMKMEGDVMKMRAVPVLDLPAGKTVQLKPSGYHLMLMDLKQPLAVGSSLPLTLIFRDSKGLQSKLLLTLPVSAAAPAALAVPGAAAAHEHKH
jgi:copper(I)-binding protein